jgi:hypothetical protein
MQHSQQKQSVPSVAAAAVAAATSATAAASKKALYIFTPLNSMAVYDEVWRLHKALLQNGAFLA